MAFSKTLPEKDASTIAHDENLMVDIPAVDIVHLADDVSYGPSGVRGLISSPYVLGAAFLASLGGFSFGYDQVRYQANSSEAMSLTTTRE